MTSNQINFNKLIEDRRHNLATESIDRQKADAASLQASVSAKSQSETERANRSKEAINWWSALESQRHNVAGENVQWGSLSETRRHNLIGEQYTALTSQAQARQSYSAAEANLYNAETNRLNLGARRSELAESVRHNQVYEAETERHNRHQESIASGQLAEQIRSNKAHVGLGYANLSEQQRANIERETEMNRSNVTRELETERANLANELIGQQRNEFSWAQLDETARHNVQTEHQASRSEAHKYLTDVWGRANDTMSTVSRALPLIVGLGG